MTSTKTIEVRVERTIPAPRSEVFDAWLDPKIPGTPWNAAEKFILDAKVDGLFYWMLKGTSHYGRSHRSSGQLAFVIRGYRRIPWARNRR